MSRSCDQFMSAKQRDEPRYRPPSKPRNLQLKLTSLKNCQNSCRLIIACKLSLHFIEIPSVKFISCPKVLQFPPSRAVWRYPVGVVCPPSVTEWLTYYQRSIVTSTGRHLTPLEKILSPWWPKEYHSLIYRPYLERPSIFSLFHYHSPPISIFSRMEIREKPDSESGSVRSEGKLVRQLKNRHVAMIRYAN